MKNFESNFDPNIEKEQEIKEADFEVMKLPEILVQEERGAQLFSLLLKAENPAWGETEALLAKETNEYFRNNPIDSEILETINYFYKEDIDEETLYNTALTYQRPERVEHLLEMVGKYKSYVKNPQEVYQKLLAILERFDQTFSNSPLAEKFSAEIERDKNKRLERIEETKNRIEVLIDYFKPNIKTTNIKKIIIVPTDPLYKKNSGRGFSTFPNEQIIISHIENVLNQDHEFCHCIINPIVEILSKQLTYEQKEKISQLASEKLKKDYGDDYFSLFCEELIRTYIEIVSKGNQLLNYEEFIQKISGMNEEQFQKLLAERVSLKTGCKQLNIKTLEDFKAKSQEYFNRFEINRLRDVIFEVYQEYSNRPNKETENFEKFVLAKFPTKI